MGISLLTALTIQSNNAQIAVGKGKNGKYGFEIYCIIREHYRPQLSSQPVYDSEQIAQIEGNKVLDSIKKLKLDNKRKELADILGDAAKPVQEIIKDSRR